MDDRVYAEVIIKHKSKKTDKVFSYLIPDFLREKIKIGCNVLVPFGNGNKTLEGYIINISRSVVVDITKLKEIKQVFDHNTGLSDEMIQLCHWMKENYGCKYIDAIQCMLPPGTSSQNKHIGIAYEKHITLTDAGIAGISQLSKNAIKQKEILEFLSHHKEIAWSELKEKKNISSALLKTLEDKGYIDILHTEKQRTPYLDMELYSKTPSFLTEEQYAVIHKIKPYIENNEHQAFLLRGVTGSGKTEVYLQLIQNSLAKSKEAILLVPEISLTSQMIERFKSRFGETVAVFHSKLTTGERYDEWRRVKNGEAKIVVGARSAVFAPFENIGIIIIDEEHENTYKSDSTPKYHTIEIAKFRAKWHNSLLVLGSATPSIESHTKAINQEYLLVEMKERYNKKPMPKVLIVDMRNELKEGNKRIFSETLFREISLKLEHQQQIILFLNRRGFSTFISCRNCGYVVKCPFCDISLTYHRQSNVATCHYCSHVAAPPKICPSCKSNYIKYFGMGTEKLEQMTKTYFPEAKVARLDLDTTSKKGFMDKTLNSFRKGKIDILIGTQMIAKGIDIPNVTLVGIIAADMNLNLPDFRAAERTFQLITQVAGRSGRGEEMGNVIVQTYQPDHYAILTSKEHDYISFYEKEIKLREELYYPPFAKLLNVVISGENELSIKQTAQFLSEKIYEIIKKKYNDRNKHLFGPHPAPLWKIKQNYRWQIIIKIDPVDQNLFKDIIKYITVFGEEKYYKENISIIIDSNPYNML